MSELHSYRDENSEVIDFIKNRIKNQREEASETLDTLFYIAMKPYQDYFLIVDEYSINDTVFKTDVYHASSDLTKSLEMIYDKTKSRHNETFKVKSLLDQSLKETMHLPLQYIKGYIVENGHIVYPFGLFSPREKTYFEWVKDGMFSKKQVETVSEMKPGEISTNDFYYSYNLFDKSEIDERTMQNIQLLIVKATQRNFSLSDEMFGYRKLERTWESWKVEGSSSVDEFENFMKNAHEFKEVASPEVKPLVENFFQTIINRKSIMNQYDLIKQFNSDTKIYFD